MHLLSKLIKLVKDHQNRFGVVNLTNEDLLDILLEIDKESNKEEDDDERKWDLPF